MAVFYIFEEVDRIGVRVDLTDEPEGLDLSENGLGDEVLDLAIEGMLSAVEQGRAPETGRHWAENAPSTKKAKGHGMPGFRTGRMLDPSNWTDGNRDVAPRYASWAWSGPNYGVFFHSGAPERNQPPRPIVGWTTEARNQAQELIRNHAQALEG